MLMLQGHGAWDFVILTGIYISMISPEDIAGSRMSNDKPTYPDTAACLTEIGIH